MPEKEGGSSARSAPVVEMSGSPFCRVRPLSIGAVRIEDGFWAPRRAMIRTVALPSQYRLLEETGRLRNFRRAAGRIQGEFEGRVFNDSDVYKWLEAAAWTVATESDAGLAARVSEVTELIAAAQEESGYLDTYFTGERAAQRWTDLVSAHELYCVGHLIQAAVAVRRATGSRRLLDVAVRLADHIARVFGPAARRGACGHPEVEMALVELFRETGEERYLRQAEIFIDQRGQQPPVAGGRPYAQDHAPFREQQEVVGHAVRALYLYCGATDLYAETGDRTLWQALEALWQDLHERKVYITGGVGARHEDEAVGEAYELPNRRAYAETCAAVAHVMWSWRMLLVAGEARFADALETALYNGLLCGISLDGKEYFYENPLADRGSHRREPWFECACCPPNIARLLASLPGYMYSSSNEGLWVHLYAAGSVRAAVPGAGEVIVRQRTAYPWDGEIELEVWPHRPAPFGMMVRIPAWCERATIRVNGEEAGPAQPGSYATVRRRWQRGDVLRLHLPMPVRLTASHPHVIGNHGRVAIARGPLVYCVEGADHPDVDVWDLHLPIDVRWTSRFEPDLLGGVVALRTTGLAPSPEARYEQLYAPYEAPPRPETQVELTAIPYYAWGNREAGPMQTWIPTVGKPTGVPSNNLRSASSSSCHAGLAQSLS